MPPCVGPRMPPADGRVDGPEGPAYDRAMDRRVFLGALGGGLVLAAGCGLVDANKDYCVGLLFPGQATDDCIKDATVDMPRGATRTLNLVATTKNGASLGTARIAHNGGAQSNVVVYEWSSLDLPVPGQVTLTIRTLPTQNAPAISFPSIVELTGAIDESLDLVVNVQASG